MINEHDGVNCLAGLERQSQIDDEMVTAVPIDKIHIKEAQRNFKAKSSPDKNLVESVKEYGVLQPILVQQQEQGYLVISGERRVHASREAGLNTIPAIVFGHSLSKEDFLMIQMIENLQRENPDPITEAKGYLSYFQMILGCPGLEDSIAKLILHGRNSKRLGVESAEKISALEAISGKTSRTIQNLLNLLRLPNEAQQAIVDNRISLSQGYILSRYTLHHRFMTVLRERLMQEKMTNKDLESLFENSQGIDHANGSKRFRADRSHLRRMRLALEEKETYYDNSEKEELHKEVELLQKVLATKIDG